MRCSEPGHRVQVAIERPRGGRVAELGSFGQETESPLMTRLHRILWKHATLLFSVFMIVGLTGILWIETPYNAPFVWTLRWLTLPVLLISSTLAFTGWSYYRYTMGLSAQRTVFGAVAVPAFVLLFTAGFVNIINAAFPRDSWISFSGTVKSIWTPRRDFEDYRVTVTLDGGEEQKFYVRRSVRPPPKTGQRFSVRMRLGLLGFPFEPTWPFETVEPHKAQQSDQRPNKTDAGIGSKAICRVSNVLPLPAGGARRVVFDKLCQLMRVSLTPFGQPLAVYLAPLGSLHYRSPSPDPKRSATQS